MRRLVLGLAVAVAAAFPVVGNADDRQIAEFIKSKLQGEQQAGNLKGFNIDMRVDKGTIWFSGYVANQAQEDIVMAVAQQAGSLGAVQVVDDIEVNNTMPAPVQQTLAPMPAPVNQQAQMVSYQEPMPAQIPATGAQLGGTIVEAQGMPMNAGGPMPMPMGYCGDANMGGGAPSMPGYAWPGYAAHPNYAAVTYPKQYSASAWPYIGPFYPYPQVPMGWRKVQLEWDDGWWYLDFKDR
jgi:BON domain